MSRTIFAALLFSLFALGCGSKPAPEQPNVQLDPKNEPKQTANPTYEMDPAKHVIPAEPVAGKLAGVDVAGPEVRLEGKNLILQKPPAAAGDDWRLSIELPAEPAHDAGP